MSVASSAEVLDEAPVAETHADLATLFRSFMAEQRQINADNKAKQEQLLSFVSSLPIMADADIDADEDYKRQMYMARHSRPSVYASNNSVTASADIHNFTSPLRPPVPARSDRLTKEEQERRASHGNPLYTPLAARPTNVGTTSSKETSANVPATSTNSVPGGPIIDRGRNSPYGLAHQAISKMDKYYGDKKHDKDIDVHSFVRSVEFELDCWMSRSAHGRLELVISATSGAARDWLLYKRHDLQTLVARGDLRPEMAEWEAVRAEFIERMGGAQTERLYATKLRDLRLGRGGSDDVMKFITTFREYATRAYPLHEHPDTRARSLMLGRMFEEAVSNSDFDVWKEAMRTRPQPQTLEDWEVALSTAWTTEQTVRDQRKRVFGDRKKAFSPTVTYPSSNSVKVNQMETEGESMLGTESSEGTGGGEGLNAASTKKVADKRTDTPRKRNSFINGATAAQLIRLGRCLHCYQLGHYADKCRSPAARAPNSDELKEKAGQQ